MSWLAATHIVGLILWLGGLITLARLLGHHVSLTSKEAREALVPFERKSYFMAVLPGFLLALGSGLTLLVMNGPKIYFAPGSAWGMTFHIKLTLILVLIVLDQLIAAKMRKVHREDTGNRGFFMATHGIVGLLMIVIVFMVKTNVLGG
ncbi:MAG: CopD family protein [bacterium]